jgi:hypothetical protein
MQGLADPQLSSGVCMDAGISTERQARTQHRHELRTLTYVTLDQANGGIVRNLNHNGIGVQVVAAVRPLQQLRIRFELRFPRTRVETRGEVVWATFSGQCGIRFLDLPPSIRRHLNEWILGDLLESISLHVEHSDSIFAKADLHPGNGHATVRHAPEGDAEPEGDVEEDDGLLLSGTPAKVIALPMRREAAERPFHEFTKSVADEPGNLDWLSQPLSARGIARSVDTLAVIAGLLIFALVFLAVTRETPPWPLAMTAGGAVLMALLYRGFFWVVGGESLGTRLARKTGLGSASDDDESS